MANRPSSRKGGFIRIAAIFIGIVLFVFFSYVILKAIELKQGQDSVQKIAEALKKDAEERRAEEMADTYGGKTPQETLGLYITAVEKGDYELASKYFVKEKQEFWKKELIRISNSSKISDYLKPLKVSMKSKGEFGTDGKSFSFYDPINIDFIVYPNGIWKIIEI